MGKYEMFAHGVSQGPAIQFDKKFGRRFLITIDTEEDFDWDKPFSRDGYRLDSTHALADSQAYFRTAGANPLYLVDYPVTRDPTARDILGKAAADGQAEIGLQLHPWVTPPFDEDVNVHNSYAGNLDIDLERAKLRTLYDALVEGFGVTPNSYRAGRYGLGPNTYALLDELGIRCDTSARANFDYRRQGGPNYRRVPLSPFWTGPENRIAEFPLTTVFHGNFGKLKQALFESFSDTFKLRSVLARTGIAERIPLTPEGTDADDAVRAVAVCAKLDLPLVVLSFHSPSLVPGNTPYVRDAGDLARFYLWWDRVLTALDEQGYRSISLSEAIDACIFPTA